MLIHRHDQTPFLEHQGFSIRPGTETTIGIREVGRPSLQASNFCAQPQGPWGLGKGAAELKKPPPPRTRCTGLGAPMGTAPTAQAAWTCVCCTRPPTPSR